MDDRPDAIFAYNDLAALGFQKAVLDAGLSVPDDIALVGFDNIRRGQIAAVPLTTVAQPTAEIGEIALEHLAALIQGSQPPARTILQPQLIIRNSCGAPEHAAGERPVHKQLPVWSGKTTPNRV